tara:strand:+ start:11530 stop:11667 length:138 start_codon:yes stop_codon:yes gene_type:complete
MIKKIVEYVENIFMDIYMGYVTEHEQLALIGLFLFVLGVMVFILA